MERINIISGPGRVKLGYGLLSGKEITFVSGEDMGEEQIKILVRLSSIEKKDSSNQNWDLKGILRQKIQSMFSLSSPFFGYYNTQNRQGRFFLSEK